MTTPADGFFINQTDNSGDCAYVKSISYGKISYVSIESEYSFSEVKSAFEVGVKYKFVGVDMKYEQKTLEVFSKSKITTLTTAENGKESYYMNAIENLSEIFKSDNTDKAYGKPIYTELSLTKDNSLFIPPVNNSGGNRPSNGGGRPNTGNRPSYGSGRN